MPTLFIQPDVENAIWHGLEPKKENLSLHIRVTKQPDGHIFEIEDNGVGRASAASGQQKGHHISKGMTLAKESFDYYGLTCNMQTQVDLIDLYDDRGSARGTCVKLSLFK